MFTENTCRKREDGSKNFHRREDHKYSLWLFEGAWIKQGGAMLIIEIANFSCDPRTSGT
jgi:hypothetical protein